jgi:hypothetical protein
MSYIDQNHLWGAYDTNMIALDELNGPGVQWMVDVLEYAEGEEVFIPLLMNQVDLWEDISATIPADDRDIMVRHENREFQVR